jgi:hypothetical protein
VRSRGCVNVNRPWGRIEGDIGGIRGADVDGRRYGCWAGDRLRPGGVRDQQHRGQRRRRYQPPTKSIALGTSLRARVRPPPTHRFSPWSMRTRLAACYDCRSKSLAYRPDRNIAPPAPGRVCALTKCRAPAAPALPRSPDSISSGNRIIPKRPPFFARNAAS